MRNYNKTSKGKHMAENKDLRDPHHADSHLDAFAAVALIMVAVLTVVFWISQQ